MEPIAHNYLTKLRIISKIPENGQLDLTNNDLNIYSPGLVSWIHRKISGDGKINTVGFLRSFYREIILFTDEIMASISMEPNRATKRSRYVLLATLAKKIKESQSGFINLKRTYQNYPKIISMLESIEQDLIETQLQCISAFLPKAVPKKDGTSSQAGLSVSDPIDMVQVEPEHSPESSPELSGKFARPPPNTPSEII
jgi:hypothetical protein